MFNLLVAENSSAGMCFKNNFVFLIVFLYVCLLTKCGRIKRVVGAVEVECGTQPNIASLRQSGTLRHTCGATLISPHYALTAAHCVPSKEDEYILQFNNYCIESNDTIPKATIVEIIRHEFYDPVTRAHDVALLRVALLDDITWLKVKRNTLPRSSFGISGECTIYGYGYRDLSTKETSDKLLAGALKLVSLDECERALGPYVAPKCDGGMMCAVGDNVDACQGDSGSPLICAGSVIEGISSYGMSCAVPGLPGVYTSVGAHIQWIRDIIQSDEIY